MSTFMEKLKKLGRKGQTTTEYVIILGLVALGSIAVILIFGNQVRELFSSAARRLAGEDATVESHTDDDAVERDDIRDAFQN